jgi:hypothetical protein
MKNTSGLFSSGEMLRGRYLCICISSAMAYGFPIPIDLKQRVNAVTMAFLLILLRHRIQASGDSTTDKAISVVPYLHWIQMQLVQLLHSPKHAYLLH